MVILSKNVRYVHVVWVDLLRSAFYHESDKFQIVAPSFSWDRENNTTGRTHQTWPSPAKPSRATADLQDCEQNINDNIIVNHQDSRIACYCKG